MVVVVVNKKFLVELCKANFVGTRCVSARRRKIFPVPSLILASKI